MQQSLTVEIFTIVCSLVIGAAGGSSTTAMFPRSMMPADALRQIEECARKFMSWQVSLSIADYYNHCIHTAICRLKQSRETSVSMTQ